MNTQGFTAPRLVISGLSGGGGKTLFSLGLTRLLVQRGFTVMPCKKGPDYIDAGWLGLAARRAPVNLDPYFLSEERLRSLFQHAHAGADIAIIEGNRGLYDGKDVHGSCSTAALSRTLQAPILLVLSVTKMTRTAAALVAGLAAFEPIRLAGVVLNQIGSPRHAKLIRQCIEEATTIPVLGELPRLKENPIPERHMGLASIHSESAEDVDPHAALDTLAHFIGEHVNVDAILQIAHAAPALAPAAPFWPEETAAPVYALQSQTPQSLSCPSPDPTAAPTTEGTQKSTPAPRIGFVRDAALWFYYEENLEALRRAGAELVELSLLDAAPWPRLDGLYLGGGFPEVVAKQLSQSPHLADLRRLSQIDCPIYAECGGFMVLCDSIRVDDCEYPMSGLFPATAVFCPRPQGLGYVEATVSDTNPFHPLGALLRGHEFHYSHCVANGPLHPVLTLSPGTGMAGPGHRAKGLSTAPNPSLQGRDGLLIRQTFASYTHLFAPCVPHWAPLFVQACRQSKKAFPSE